jgi:hypothetical protein
VSFAKAENYIATNPEQPVFLFLHSYYLHEYWTLYFPGDQKVSKVLDELRQDERFAEAERPDFEKFMNDATPEERHELYARAALDCDGRLSQFLASLKQSPIFSNVKIIITSDHGEGLGDIHEEYVSKMHALSPYSEQTHVPLIVYGNGVGKTDQLVGVDDIAGTILQFAGIEKDGGKSLFRERDFVVSEYVPYKKESASRSVAVISNEEKLLLANDGNLHLFRDDRDREDLIEPAASQFIGWAALEGLMAEEGPYPELDTPVIRWAYGPRTILKFWGDGKTARLILRFRRNEYQDQTMRISLNGEHLEEIVLGAEYRFHQVQLPLQTRDGENTLVFEYSRMQGERNLTVCFQEIMVLSEGKERLLPAEVRYRHAIEFPFTGWDEESGLGPKSGPFPEWDLPAVRWGLGPRTEFVFESDGKPLMLSMTCSPYHVVEQELTILLNGKQIFRREFIVPYEFDEFEIPIKPNTGSNRLTFKYRTWDKTDPENATALLFKQLRIIPPEFSFADDTAHKKR